MFKIEIGYMYILNQRHILIEIHSERKCQNDEQTFQNNSFVQLERKVFVDNKFDKERE